MCSSSPTAAEILNHDDWIEHLLHIPKTPMVIPHLEWFFLRHHYGLDLLRKLLTWLQEQNLRCLIGCNSWGWAYLEKAIQLAQSLPHPLTLAPCNQDHLGAWFTDLAADARRFGFAFRLSSNGKPVLSLLSVEETTIVPEKSDYLRRLATFTRGNPGIAWAIWRSSLLYEPDDDISEKAIESAQEDRKRTLWVRTLDQMDLIRLPVALSREQRFVLHTILLHGGLASADISNLLPSMPSETAQNIRHLQHTGLLTSDHGRWQVNKGYYPAIRSLLAQEGFLVDNL